MANAPGKGRTFTWYFFDNYFSLIPDIIESPVIKIVFRDHLWIWRLLLGVMKEMKLWCWFLFQNLLELHFFLELGFWSVCMYFWWYCLRTCFIWWPMWSFFFRMVPLVSVLQGFASVSIFWECLGELMLHSIEAISWWSSSASTCGWQLSSVEIFRRSSKSWSMMLSLRLIYISRFLT